MAVDTTPARKIFQQIAQTDSDKLWPIVEKAVTAINDLQQGHVKDGDSWRDVNLQASSDAYAAFPELAKQGIPRSMVGGIILNEVKHRDIRDFIEDFAAANNLGGDAVSIGPGQLQIANIRALAAKYPHLQKFGDPVQAALDPAKAPYFVAAYLNDRLVSFEEHNRTHPESPIVISPASLAYSYNPDVLQRDGSAPGSDSYRSKTAGEMVATRLSKWLTGQPVASLHGWHSVDNVANEWIADRSELVKGIFQKMKLVEEAQNH